jgi:hypothetical protein
MTTDISYILSILRNPPNPSNYELELLAKSLFDKMTLEQEFHVTYQFIKLSTSYFLEKYSELNWVERWLLLANKFVAIDYPSEKFAFYGDYESKEAHWFAYAISVADSTHQRIVEGYTKEALGQRDNNLSYAIATIIGTQMATHQSNYFPDSTITEAELKSVKPEELIARVEKYKNAESTKQLRKNLWTMVADCIEAYSGL